MRIWGALLIAVGLLLTFAAFNMRTSVYSVGGDVNNLGLLQQQMMVLQTGLAAFIAGAVLVGCGAIAPANNEVIGRTATIRNEEFDDEREARLAGVRRLNRIIGFTILGFVAVIIVIIAIGT